MHTDDISVHALSRFNAHNYGLLIYSLEVYWQQFSFIQQPHRSQYYTILFAESDGGTVYIDNEKIQLQSQMVVCITPDSVARFEFSPNTMGCIILFSEAFFSLRYNDNVLNHFSCLKGNVVCKQQLEGTALQKWQFLIHAMNQEYNNADTDTKNILRSYLNIILSELNKQTPVSTEALSVSKREQTVIAFENLLSSFFKEEKFPWQYAQKLNISVNYLNRICNERRKMSCGDLIRKRIIIEAERLLHYTTNNISEIAYDLGFESTSYFTTFFKKHTGLSPESYRRKMLIT